MTLGLASPARRYDAEWMDRPDNSPAELAAALQDIRRVNRWLGGERTLLDAIRPMIDASHPRVALRVLDVGTGTADLPLALVRNARQRGRSLRVAAVDRDAHTVRLAAGATRSEPEIQLLRADASALPFATNSFDLVVASMFLHHFDETAAVALLRGWLRLAPTVVINDLHRHRLPWLSIWLLARITRRGPMFVHDAPLSVLRGFTPAELAELARAAGGQRIQVRRRWPFRLLLTFSRDETQR